MALIGIVEDDTLFADEIIRQLTESADPLEIRHWTAAEGFLQDLRGNGASSIAQPDLLLLDLNLPGMNGIGLLKDIASHVDGSNEPLPFPVVVLTSLDSERHIFEALKLGAVGYILKNEIGAIADHVATVLAGGGIMSPTIAVRVIADFQTRGTDGRNKNVPAKAKTKIEDLELTKREREVLEWIVSGLSAREVADILCVSTHTVRVHVKHIYRKLYVGNKVELMREARRLGLF